MSRIFIFALITLFPLQAGASECPRTLSIGGAITEIVYKLGKQDCLVGVDTTSTYPEAASKLPMVGYQRMLNAEGILSLKPDVIIHTNQAGPPTVLKQIDQAGIKRIEIKDEPSLEAVYAKIEAVSAVFGIEDQGEKLIGELVRQREALALSDTAKPRVLFVMSHGGGTPMVGGKGTAADAIINLAGGDNVVSFDRYKPLTPEALATLNPEFIVTTEDSLTQMGGISGLLHMPGVSLTQAGKNKRVVSMDALLILGFGPRTIEAAQTLSEQLSMDIQ